jgi:hypothetical protein
MRGFEMKQDTDNARAKKRANMTKLATLTHYPNQMTFICRADGSYWFGASKYFVMHLRAKK